MTRVALLFTCEHGGAQVPARLRPLFADAGEALASHRGLDIGALKLARELARALRAPLLACTTSRLVVDANRSLGHPRLFSEFTRGLPAAERERLVERHWRPHRAAVTAQLVAARRSRRRLVHVSVHSFTPVWEGVERDVDVGLLYDPSRPGERELAGAWIEALRERDGELRLRRNQPYRGTADGVTSALRKQHGAERYVGLELEVSQRFPRGDARAWRRLRRDLADSLDVAYSLWQSSAPR